MKLSDNFDKRTMATASQKRRRDIYLRALGVNPLSWLVPMPPLVQFLERCVM